jgi:sulfite reductase alpha subunit-like flavoprotein
MHLFLLVLVLVSFFPVSLNHNSQRCIVTDLSFMSETIWILFASQTGNSEQAARQIASEFPTKIVGSLEPKVASLDDFLEIEHASWSRIVILCLSSYGVGQAPLGGYRFREVCDHVIDQKGCDTVWKDLQYCILGLGDSRYTTFFQNPTTTIQALELAGAKRIGPIGKADASGDQLKLIEDWIAGLWKPLQKALNETPKLTKEQLQELQHETLEICKTLDPEFMKQPASHYYYSVMIMPLLVVLLAVIMGYVFLRVSEIPCFF